MRVVIPGGSGQVGAVLVRAFLASGDDVVVLSRRAGPGPGRQVAWDGETVGPWAQELDGADVVINLAGRSVQCRYGPKNRAEMMDSRVRSTRAVGEAISKARRPPPLWLQASTATIYAHRFDAPNDEATGIIGGAEPGAPETWRFSIDVVKAWEAALAQARVPGTRKVAMRAAMIMDPARRGIFATLLGLVRRGLGGPAGDGRQFISWIHEKDFVAAVRFLIAREDLSGPVNLASPNPLSNAEFMRILRNAAGIRVGLPAAEWMLAIGAWLLRSETELILKSRRVVPRRLLEAGFVFQLPRWEDAAADLCERWKKGA